MALFSFIVDEVFTLTDFLEENGAGPGSILDLVNQKGYLSTLLTNLRNTRSYHLSSGNKQSSPSSAHDILISNTPPPQLPPDAHPYGCH